MAVETLIGRPIPDRPSVAPFFDKKRINVCKIYLYVTTPVNLIARHAIEK